MLRVSWQARSNWLFLTNHAKARAVCSTQFQNSMGLASFIDKKRLYTRDPSPQVEPAKCRNAGPKHAKGARVVQAHLPLLFECLGP